MASPQLPPPLLLLGQVLLLKPAGSFCASLPSPGGADVTGFSTASKSETESPTSKPLTSSSSHSSLSSELGSSLPPSAASSELGSSLLPSTAGSEQGSTTPHSPSNSGTTPTIQPSPSSTQPEITTHPSSGSPTSHSSPLISTSLTLHWRPTSSSLGMEPSFRPSATTDRTPVASGLRDTGAPELHRNPGMVVAVCLLVSVLLIGSVVMAVRRCHQGVSEFQKLHEVSLGTVSRRSSFAHPRPE
ncbi:uncharacterized LOC729966 homolog isoform X2 [Diceros bicornis minor]|uniref:uncharacterized LOC729966 homolog isoform X2 n=1 Tax=Diceros bicornis minor TaxID=77932 RepID=UPI0026F0BB39|nr:uncharacterized LOC729966 homolog isoform X2 [Diceros bicornis minor]